MESVTVASLKLYGGHPVLDFANTVDPRDANPAPATDALRSFGDLLDWGARLSVLPSEEAEDLRGLAPAEGDAALARAKALREALYRIFAAPDAAGAEDLDLLQRTVWAAATERELIRAPDGYAWRWRRGSPDGVTYRIAWAAADLLASPAVARVRVCPGENCAWLFLDKSRSGHRIWCSEETCGMRNRVRRWRDRQRPKSGLTAD